MLQRGSVCCLDKLRHNKFWYNLHSRVVGLRRSGGGLWITLRCVALFLFPCIHVHISAFYCCWIEVLQPSSKQLLVHILTPETDNCPSCISRREKMTVENIWWSVSTKECCLTRWRSNQPPSDHQSDVNLTEAIYCIEIGPIIVLMMFVLYRGFG